MTSKVHAKSFRFISMNKGVFALFRVSECYKNEKRIDHACKQLTVQSNLLSKQSQAWINLIGQFTVALKVTTSF